jgi:toxin CcdB
MARFDVYRHSGPHASKTPFLVDIQSNHLAGLATRVVIPLRLRDSFASVALPADLTPIFTIVGLVCFLDTPKLAAIPLRELGSPLTSLEHQQSELFRALDRLMGAY